MARAELPGPACYVEEVLASGFPGIRTLTGRARRTRLSGYPERVVDGARMASW